MPQFYYLWNGYDNHPFFPGLLYGLHELSGTRWILKECQPLLSHALPFYSPFQLTESSFMETFLWEVAVALLSPSPYRKETDAGNGSLIGPRPHSTRTSPEPKTRPSPSYPLSSLDSVHRYSKTLVCEHNSFQKHACHPKQISRTFGSVVITWRSASRTTRVARRLSFIELKCVRNVRSPGRMLAEQVTHNPRFYCISWVPALQWA